MVGRYSVTNCVDRLSESLLVCAYLPCTVMLRPLSDNRREIVACMLKFVFVPYERELFSLLFTSIESSALVGSISFCSLEY